MANTLQSLKPFGRYWSAVCLMDSANGITIKVGGESRTSIVPAGTKVKVISVTNSFTLSAALGHESISLLADNGDELLRWGMHINGAVAPVLSESALTADGLTLYVNSITSAVVASITVVFQFIGGTAPVEV
jgi:hypothetical protein